MNPKHLSIMHSKVFILVLVIVVSCLWYEFDSLVLTEMV
jgi:hypothetical protein